MIIPIVLGHIAVAMWPSTHFLEKISWLERGSNLRLLGLELRFSNAGSRLQMRSLGNFLRVAAELWGRGVASIVEE